MQKRPEIVVAFFGDGAMNRGPLFEAFNWAKLFQLPVLFVCEDNGFSVTLRTREVTGGPPAVDRVPAFGIPVTSVDGNDVVAVERAARGLAEQMRYGSGPRFLHATTYRWHGHLAHDRQLYRDPAEIERVRQYDPIAHAERWLAQRGTGAEELQALRDDCLGQIEAAVAEALAAPFPPAASAFTDVQDIGSPA